MMNIADDYLNGSFAGPVAVAPAASTGPTPGNASNSNAVASGNSKAVLMAWLVLFALLVISNVVTLSVQR